MGPALPPYHGKARYKQTAETAATGKVVGEYGVEPFEHVADLKGRTQAQTGIEAMLYNARGVSNDQLAEASAVLSMSRPGNYAIAAQNMAATGFLDKVFNRTNAATQQQLMQHGFGMGAIRSLSAIQAQSNYAVSTVLDGYDVYMTSDAEGNYGSNMISARKGFDVSVNYNYDNISELGHNMVGDNIGHMETAARTASGLKTVGDVGLAVLPGGKVFNALEAVGKVRANGGLLKGYVKALNNTFDKNARVPSAKGGAEGNAAPRPHMPNGEVQPGVEIKTVKDNGKNW
ncbi:hypothetical protein [Hydrogenimonas sp.]